MLVFFLGPDIESWGPCEFDSTQGSYPCHLVAPKRLNRTRSDPALSALPIDVGLRPEAPILAKRYASDLMAGAMTCTIFREKTDGAYGRDGKADSFLVFVQDVSGAVVDFVAPVASKNP